MFDEKKYLECKKNWKTWLQNNGLYKCPICNKEYSVYGIGNHLKYHFGYIGSFTGKEPPNKGKTKENCESIRKGSENLKSRYANGELTVWCQGKSLSDEHKEKISKSMKKAHKEGRAYNIGYNTHIGESSYPEKFFVKVIENEFIDKNYTPQYQFSIYKLDFAWVHLKKCIEIDGDQHYRFEDYHERDIRKDELLNQRGWEVLRIRWKDIFNETQKWINTAKQFIDDGVSIKFEDNYRLWTQERDQELEEKELEEKELRRKANILLSVDNLHEIAIKVNKVIDANIDFTKFGWVNKVNQITDQPNGRRWVKRWCPWLLENTFKRGNTIEERKIIAKQKEIDKLHDIAIKVNKVIDTNIDFNRLGWVKEVANIVNITSNGSRPWLKRWAPWLLD